MKLFLASYHLSPNGSVLSDLFSENKNIAIIPNSRDCYPDDDRKTSDLDTEINDLRQVGLVPEVLDLRDFFGKSNLLSQRLATLGGVWVLGGNTFVLRRAYQASSFDKWLQTHVTDQAFVHAGYSAGACVLVPSLKGLDLADEPNLVPEGYQSEIIWDGVGLIDFAVVPHFESPGHPETEAMNSVVAYYKKNNIQYKTLHDGEYIQFDVSKVNIL